jgi:hypothetical protein
MTGFSQENSTPINNFFHRKGRNQFRKTNLSTLQSGNFTRKNLTTAEPYCREMGTSPMSIAEEVN